MLEVLYDRTWVCGVEREMRGRVTILRLGSACLVFVVVRTPTDVFFFFNDTATTEIYTLSLHDALPS